MKFGKSKLIFSTVCLVAALALAVFTVYAWFINFEKVAAGGINSVIASNDVISLQIDYYEASSIDGATYTIGKQINHNPATCNLDHDHTWWMPPFTPRLSESDGTETAVLLDLKLTVSKAGSYALAMKTRHDSLYNTSVSNGEPSFIDYTAHNNLSNVIYLQAATLTGSSAQQNGTFSLSNTTQYKFVNSYFTGEDDEAKKTSIVTSLPPFTVGINEVIDAETGKPYVNHAYFMMDYMPDQVDALYSILLRLFPTDADLSTEIDFDCDILFQIG